MVGREKEVAELLELYNQDKAELVAIYGRRRVGKTYLVDETFKDKITFRHAGLSPIENVEQSEQPLKNQLRAFYYSLLSQGMKKEHCPKDWLEAFFMLEMHLQNIDDGSRQLIFLDELPWMDTPKSGFITGFESFWNGWACHRNVMVVISGSATSWMEDKLINNHGGLYGRITYEIKLSPFSLYECELLLNARGISLSRYDIVQSYMIFGGIPFYLNYFNRGNSLAQIIDDLFFKKGAKLSPEYDRLFSSIFTNPDTTQKIVKTLSQRSRGYTRKEIIAETELPDGGNLSKCLNALIASDFVIKYVPFGYSKREEHYKLVDPFCIFYLKFVQNKASLTETFWQQNTESQAIISWRGYAFENVCFNHIPQIKRALEIGGIQSSESAWTKVSESDESGTQIDMLILRKDNVVNMCEMKFYSDVFTVDSNYDKLLRNRQHILYEHLPKKSTIHNTLITTYGLKDNSYRWSFENVITMEELFR